MDGSIHTYILSSATVIIINIRKIAYIMISEGLCDTENTENYAEHSWCFASWRLHRNVC